MGKEVILKLQTENKEKYRAVIPSTTNQLNLDSLNSNTTAFTAKIDELLSVVSKGFSTIKGGVKKRVSNGLKRYEDDRTASKEEKDRGLMLSLLSIIAKKKSSMIESGKGLFGSALGVLGKGKKLLGIGAKIATLAGIYKAFQADDLTKASKDLLNGVSSTVSSLTGGLVNLWSAEEVDTFIAKTKTMWGNAKLSMNGTIGDFYDSLPNSIKDFFSDTKKTIGDNYNIAKSKFKDLAKQFGNWTNEKISSVKSFIVDKTVNKYKEIKSKVTSKYKEIKSKISNKIESVIDRFSSVETLMSKKGKEKIIVKKIKQQNDNDISKSKNKIANLTTMLNDKSTMGKIKRFARYGRNGTMKNIKGLLEKEKENLDKLEGRRKDIVAQTKEIEKRLNEYKEMKQQLAKITAELKELKRKKESKETPLKESSSAIKQSTKEKERLSTSSSTLETTIDSLLKRIAKGEGTTEKQAKRHGFDSAYDITLGYGKYDPKGYKPITQQTLGELDEFQTKMLQDKNNTLHSSAVGMWQVTRTTLRELKKKYGWKDDELFDKKKQDQIGLHLLEKRGLSKFKQGKLSPTRFQQNISKEWASVASPYTKKSYYGQHTGTSDKDIKKLIGDVHNHYNTSTVTNNSKATEQKSETRISIDLRPKSKNTSI